MVEAERLQSEKAFEGRVFSVDRDRVRMPNGRSVTLEIVRHPKSVVLVVRHASRHAFRRVLLGHQHHVARNRQLQLMLQQQSI